MTTLWTHARRQLREVPLAQRWGRVQRVQGLLVQAEGPAAVVGELCRIQSGAGPGLLAQVVGLQPGRVDLVVDGSLRGIAVGDRVQALGRPPGVEVGPGLFGRVLDAHGLPLDGAGPPCCGAWVALEDDAPAPMERPLVDTVLETGVRLIDAALTLGRGQRVGLFAGSGVGKSTLLAQLVRHARCDAVVVALVGERGREVREFVHQLDPAARARTVVVASTADRPALQRVRAAHMAVAIARHEAAQGRHVLLAVDSVTRLAMARREIGLSAGEPATARGYTPSALAELPRLAERCGTQASGGSVTALFSVLVEGDDMSDPVADTLRAVLDGHLVLSRALADQGRYPAISLADSISRLHGRLATASEQAQAARLRDILGLLERHRPLVELGAYQAGQHPALDQALARGAGLTRWAAQGDVAVPRAQALRELAALLEGNAP